MARYVVLTRIRVLCRNSMDQTQRGSYCHVLGANFQIYTSLSVSTRAISLLRVHFSCNVVTRHHSRLIRENTYPLHCVQQVVYLSYFTRRVEMKQRKLKISQSDPCSPGTAAVFSYIWGKKSCTFEILQYSFSFLVVKILTQHSSLNILQHLYQIL